MKQPEQTNDHAVMDEQNPSPDSGEPVTYGTGGTADPAAGAQVEADAAATSQDEAGDLNAELNAARQQAEENLARMLRVQADYDNFRRRTRQEKEDLLKYSSMKLIEQLLPVVDNFERAIHAAKDSKDPDAFAKGVDMIFKQFQQVLEHEGVEPMDVIGQPFNPEFHQAIMQVESDEHEEGVIVEEVQKGYIMKEKVLRPAMVKVSS